jgi:hypothetical protein
MTAAPGGELRAPYFQEWSFGIEHQFGSTSSLHAQYVSTRALNQPYLTQENGYQTVCPGCFAPFPYMQPADPRFGAVTQLSTGADSRYHGLQLTAERRMGRGLKGQVNYTLSRCTDEVSNGGFLQFSSPTVDASSFPRVGFFLRCWANWLGTTVPATTTFATILLASTSMNCRLRCKAIASPTR